MRIDIKGGRIIFYGGRRDIVIKVGGESTLSIQVNYYDKRELLSRIYKFRFPFGYRKYDVEY